MNMTLTPLQKPPGLATHTFGQLFIGAKEPCLVLEDKPAPTPAGQVMYEPLTGDMQTYAPLPIVAAWTNLLRQIGPALGLSPTLLKATDQLFRESLKPWVSMLPNAPLVNQILSFGKAESFNNGLKLSMEA